VAESFGATYAHVPVSADSGKQGFSIVTYCIEKTMETAVR
jgi:hypothetical protein